jgi:hypothetical protein
MFLSGGLGSFLGSVTNGSAFTDHLATLAVFGTGFGAAVVLPSE